MASALTSVAAGGTVCLGAGSYGSVSASAVKASLTTVRPVAGASVSIAGATISGSRVRFQNIKWTGSICITGSNNVIEGGSIGAVGQSCTEGRIGIKGASNTIKNMTIGPGGASDGIQFNGGASGNQILGNEFTGIKQSGCGSVHCDPIQFYGGTGTIIKGNWFHGNSTGIMSPDGNGNNSTVTDNIFVTDGEYPDQIVMSGANAGTYTHNTFVNGARIRAGNVNGQGGVTNMIVRDNIMPAMNLTNGQSAGAITQSNNIASATFVGPTSAWAGFMLAAGSAGKNAASDGKDIGATTFGRLP